MLWMFFLIYERLRAYSSEEWEELQNLHRGLETINHPTLTQNAKLFSERVLCY